MQRQPLLTDAKTVIVADASVIINLNATGCADSILKALPNPVVMSSIAADEVSQGHKHGHSSSLVLAKLMSEGHLGIHPLGEGAEEHFNQLVAGTASDTLDDGEAATIAHALERQAIAAIDERKANRICANKYPSLAVIATTDLFAHPSVEAALGRNLLADSLFNALRNARMRVPFHQTEWVVSLIGQERAGICTSLSASARLHRAELDAAIRKSG